VIPSGADCKLGWQLISLVGLIRSLLSHPTKSTLAFFFFLEIGLQSLADNPIQQSVGIIFRNSRRYSARCEHPIRFTVVPRYEIVDQYPDMAGLALERGCSLRRLNTALIVL
jgi:hypothetical protein